MKKRIWAHLWNLWRFSKGSSMARAEPHRGDEKRALVAGHRSSVVYCDTAGRSRAATLLVPPPS
ncbi:MAG: hypothetical protein D6723_01055 [Acidobacteria bacterium]|nr:MAG: hypothetical protein D6723_01055 [Acidobacteriota bacterium]